MKKQHLQYGIKDNKLVHISEVEKGLECNCICPACKSKLIAKKENKVIHHFAHYNADECEYGYQTALHLAAKEILFNAKEMIIPSLFLKFPYTNRSSIKIFDEQRITIDNIELEKTYNDIVPDIVVYSHGSKFFVEIYVTHAIDDVKLEKIKNAKVSTLEIDLSKIERDITHEDLKHYLIDSCKEKYWKYNINTEIWMKRFKDIADKKTNISRGMAQHIDYCPINIRNYRGKSYANFIDDCLYCDYLVGNEIDGILCTGKKRISTKEDYINYMRENAKKE